MKRVRFHSWIRRRLLETAGLDRFRLRELAALAQRTGDGRLRAALLLYAHENGCVDRLMKLVYDDGVRKEFEKVEDRIGAREVERLALRGTASMVLPQAYREWLDEFVFAYTAPDRNEAEKEDLCARSRKALEERDESPADVARALNLNKSNVYAYLSSGDTKRFTVETARTIYHYLAI